MAVSARAFFYVQQVEQLARRRIDQCLQSEGITAGQYLVLNLIVHHEPVSSADLARRANMTAQSMGEFIKALVQIEARVDQIEREFFGCLTGEELAHLRMLLNRVRTSELARLGE